MSSSSTRARRGFSVGCITAAVLFILLLLVLAGGAAWLFVSRPAQVALGPAVNLLTPITGSLAEVNTPVWVEASAGDASGITRIELYADGALVATQTSTLPAGSNPLLFAQNWTPLTPGRHLLIARGYTHAGTFADSDVVYVDVVGPVTITLNVDSLPRGPNVPPPSLKDIADSTNIPLDYLLAANLSLSGADPNIQLPPQIVVNIPRSRAPENGGGGSTGGSTGGAPTPPTALGVTANCASAQLVWGDSPNEEHYVVYRLGPGDSHLNRMATLSANTTIYTDTLPGLGEYRYQVAAQRGGVEGLSLMTTVHTPGACVPAALTAGTADLVLSLIALDTNTQYDGAYCYLSADGRPYDRFPPGSFSALLFDPGNPLHYDLAAQLPNRGRFVLAGHLASQPVLLKTECWGRSGYQSLLLGSFAASHAHEEWDGRELETAGAGGPGFTMHYCLSPLTSTDTPCGHLTPVTVWDGLVIPPLGLGTPEAPDQRNISVVIPPEVLVPPVDVSPTLPEPINLTLGPSRAACDQLTDGSAVLGCALFGLNTLTWEWNGNSRFTEATLTGYHVSAMLNGSPWHDWDVHPGSRKAILAPNAGLPCSAQLSYTVIAVQGTLQSVPSEPATLDTPRCVNAARLHVTLDRLHLGPSPSTGQIHDRGDICIGCPDNEFEMDGLVRVWNGTGYTRTAQSLRGWLWAASPTGGDNQIASPGDYSWADQFLGQGVYDNHSGSWSLSAPASQHNNVITSDVIRPGETVTIRINLMERDALFTHGEVCGWSFELPALAPADWAGLNQTLTGSDDAQNYPGAFFGARDDLGCQISLHVTGEAVP